MNVKSPLGNVFGLADQALISATSFVTLLVVARALEPSEFGTFTLVYMVLLFVNSLQSALVTQPHNVIAAAQSGDAYRRFTAATGVASLIFAAVAVVAVSALATAGVALRGGTASLVVAIAAATIAWQLQEVTRRILYTEGRLGGALLNDCVAYGGQAVGMAALWQAGRASVPNALYVVAATSLAAALVGAWQTHRSFGSGVDRDDLVAHWSFGKWLAAAAIGFGISANVYFYVAALIVGSAAAGELKASQLVLGPLNVLLIFLATVLPIRLSRLLAFEGEAAYTSYIRRVFVVAAPVVAVYCLAAAIFAPTLLRVLYGNRYANATNLVALFGVYYFVSFLGQMVASALNARRNTRPIFVANLVGAISTLALGWFFITASGTTGAAVGMIASAMLVNLTLVRYAMGDVRRAAISSSS